MAEKLDNDASVVIGAAEVDASFGEGIGWSDALFALLFFLQPPPTGTLRRAPPFVQYLLQVLQKWRGCERL